MNEHPDAKVRAEAVEWLVTLQDPEADPEDPYPDPEARWEAFLQWFAQSKGHLTAFTQAIDDANALCDIDPRHLIDVQKLICEARANVVRFPFEAAPACVATLPAAQASFQDPYAPPARFLSRDHFTRWPWAACAALLPLLCIPLIFARLNAAPTHYSSGIGQRVFVPLEDGSTVLLNTRTDIDIRYGPKSRDVSLLAGEAVFKIRHDEHRPFQVASGDTIVRDVGTTFAVYHPVGGETTVSVLEGRVEVLSAQNVPTPPRNPNTDQNDNGAAAPEPSADESPIPLSAGHRATVKAVGSRRRVHVDEVSALEQRRLLAWENGDLTFNGETLAQAVGEFNRYNRRQLVIADPTIADWRIGGTFQAVDLDAFIDALRKSFRIGFQMMPNAPDTVQLKREALPN